MPRYGFAMAVFFRRLRGCRFSAPATTTDGRRPARADTPRQSAVNLGMMQGEYVHKDRPDMSLSSVLRGLVDRMLAVRGYTMLKTWRLQNLREAAGRLGLAAHLEQLFARVEPDCVLDVGANRGQYRDFLRDEVGYQGEIISYEPLPTLADALVQRALIDARWHIEAAALGARPGSLDLNVMATDVFSSFLQPSATQPSQYAEANSKIGTVRVSVRTIDDEVSRLTQERQLRKFYLKLDTQGYDLEVFRGAGQVLSSIVALQSEVSVVPLYEAMPDWLTAIQDFQANGFEVTGMFPVGRDLATLRVVEFDCVLVRSRGAVSRYGREP